MDFVLWGLPGAVVTALVLQGIKALAGDVIKDRLAVLASIIVGLSLSALAFVAKAYPVDISWVDIIGAGLLAGLGACGIYSGTKSRS